MNIRVLAPLTRYSLPRVTREALERFERSLKIGYFEWHEGIGYDVAALRELTAEELAVAESWVIERSLADWRDVEALAAIGTERCLTELRKGLSSTRTEIRLASAECLVRLRMLSPAELEAIVLAALDVTSLLDGMTRALRLAASRPSAAIRRKLLSCARDGNDDIRAHAAALAHHLYGGSRSAFDMRFRPLYLRFSSGDASVRQAAYDELCAAIVASGGVLES